MNMKAQVKMSSVDNADLSGLKKFFDNITSQVRRLLDLGVENRTYESLLCPIILKKLPNELK